MEQQPAANFPFAGDDYVTMLVIMMTYYTNSFTNYRKEFSIWRKIKSFYLEQKYQLGELNMEGRSVHKNTYF